MAMKQGQYADKLTRSYNEERQRIYFSQAVEGKGEALPSLPVQPFSVRATIKKDGDDIVSEGYMITFKKSNKRAWLLSDVFYRAGVMRPSAIENCDEVAVDQLGWNADLRSLIVPKAKAEPVNPVSEPAGAEA